MGAQGEKAGFLLPQKPQTLFGQQIIVNREILPSHGSCKAGKFLERLLSV